MKPTSSLSRRLVLQAAAGAAALAVMKLQAAESALTRRYEVLDLDWADVARQRPVPVRLYLPAEAEGAGGRVPLVVFSHGIGGSRRGYSYLGQHFARHGVASLHLQHVGSDRTLWSGSVFSLVGRLQSAAQDAEAIARAQDLRFALDTLLAGDLAPRIDAARIVAAGHSYGANTTLLVAGARVPREGREIVLRDERVRAAIAISAPPFYGESEPRRVLSAITVPSLHVTATDDVIRIPGYFSGSDDRVAVYEATGSERKWLAVFEGGSHSMFTDRAGTGGVALNPQVKAATQALTLAFVRTVFDGDSRALAAWPQQHAGILARFSGPA
jgi:pimeloyl-ACP methyl ester carboxylesterase